MTDFGDDQGGSGREQERYGGQQPGGDQPRLGQQYGGRGPRGGTGGYGQQSYGRQQFGPPANIEQPWGGPLYDRPPQHNPRSAYAASPSTYQSGFRTGYRLDPSRRRLGVPSLLTTAIGTALLVLGFTTFDWYHNIAGDTFGSGTSGDAKFNDLHDGISHLQSTLDSTGTGASRYVGFGIADAYFSWLAWVLLGIAVVAAIISALPTAATPAMRAVSALAALCGTGATVWALQVFTVSGPVKSVVEARLHESLGFGFWLEHSYLGAWFTIAGFVVVAFGGVMGSNRS